MRYLNDGKNGVPHGLKERFSGPMTAAVKKCSKSFDFIDQVLLTPLPLPYAHLQNSLVLIYLCLFPFYIDIADGWMANVLFPTVAAAALFGITSTSREIENPFGDDANDFDTLELINQLEVDAHSMLKSVADGEAVQKLSFRPLPREVQPTTRARDFLVWTEQLHETAAATFSQKKPWMGRSSLVGGSDYRTPLLTLK